MLDLTPENDSPLICERLCSQITPNMVVFFAHLAVILVNGALKTPIFICGVTLEFVSSAIVVLYHGFEIDDILISKLADIALLKPNSGREILDEAVKFSTLIVIFARYAQIATLSVMFFALFDIALYVSGESRNPVVVFLWFLHKGLRTLVFFTLSYIGAKIGPLPILVQIVYNRYNKYPIVLKVILTCQLGVHIYHWQQRYYHNIIGFMHMFAILFIISNYQPSDYAHAKVDIEILYERLKLHILTDFFDTILRRSQHTTVLAAIINNYLQSIMPLWNLVACFLDGILKFFTGVIKLMISFAPLQPKNQLAAPVNPADIYTITDKLLSLTPEFSGAEFVTSVCGMAVSMYKLAASNMRSTLASMCALIVAIVTGFQMRDHASEKNCECYRICVTAD